MGKDKTSLKNKKHQYKKFVFLIELILKQDFFLNRTLYSIYQTVPFTLDEGERLSCEKDKKEEKEEELKTIQGMIVTIETDSQVKMIKEENH